MPLKYNSDSLQNLRFKFPVSWLEKQNREFTVAASEQTQLTTYFQSLFFEAFAEFFKENKTFAKQTTAFNCTGCFPSMAPNQMAHECFDAVGLEVMDYTAVQKICALLPNYGMEMLQRMATLAAKYEEDTPRFHLHIPSHLQPITFEYFLDFLFPSFSLPFLNDLKNNLDFQRAALNIIKDRAWDYCNEDEGEENVNETPWLDPPCKDSDNEVLFDDDDDDLSPPSPPLFTK